MKQFDFLIVFLTSLFLCASSEGRGDEQIRRALDYFFPQSSGNISMSLISGGYSKASNYLIKQEDKEYVLRIYTNEQELEVQGEFYALQEASRLGVSPHVYGVYLDAKAVLMDYIHGHTLSIDEAKRPCNIQKIAEAVRQAHRIKDNPYPRKTFFEKAEEKYHRTSYEKLSREAIEAIRRDQNLLSPKNNQVNLHGDLNPRNIFINEQRVLFIDWCNTHWGDPFYDLTFFSLLHGYSLEEERDLLRSYLQRLPTLEEESRFSVIRRINLYYICLICLHIASDLLHEMPDQRIDRSATPLDWLYYMNSFARSDQTLSPQFFFECATLAFRRAETNN